MEIVPGPQKICRSRN